MNTRVMLIFLLICWVITGCSGLSQSESDETPAGGSEAPSSPLDPLPGEEKMVRGEATVSASELIIMESYPLQVILAVKGTLPTPCHYLRAVVHEPDGENAIHVELYSMVDPEVICVQVLQAYETKIPLGSYPDGSYSVYLNKELVGEFTQ